jgi:hypothetical protein
MYGDDDNEEPLPLTPLECVGRDGLLRTFFLEGPKIEPGSSGVSVHLYRVQLRDPPRPEVDQYFEASFTEQGQVMLRVSLLMANGQEHFRGKGIPEALILHVGARSDRKVVSSSNLDPDVDEYRKPNATKVWERLVAMGQAERLPGIDRYVLLKPQG